MQMIRQPSMRLTLNDSFVLMIGSFALAFGKNEKGMRRRLERFTRHPDAGFLSRDCARDILPGKNV